MVTHVSNAQLKRIIADAQAAERRPSADAISHIVNEGEYAHGGVSFWLEWLSPPIPNMTGWYWCFDEQPVNGPFSTAELAHADAVASIEEQQA